MNTHGVSRKTSITTDVGTIEVSSVRGRIAGIFINETCVFLPPILATMHGCQSEVIGTYDDHERIVDSLNLLNALIVPHVGH